MGFLETIGRIFSPLRGPSSDMEPVLLRQRDRTLPLMLHHLESQLDGEEEGTEPVWGWDRDAIQEAAIALDSGDFEPGEELYEAITRLGRVSSALRRRTEGIRRFPFKLDYEDGAPDKVREYADALLKIWDEAVLSTTGRSEVIKRLIMFGFVPCRINKPLIDGQRVTKLDVWTHRTLQWERDREGWTGTDKEGKEVFIPRYGDDEWVVFSLGGRYPWLSGALRELARIFAQILQNEDLWDSNNEELGYAMKLLSVPNAVREQTEVQEAWEVVSKLRSGDVWLQPQGYKLELLESKRGDVHQNFKTRLDVLATSISIILLGHNLAQETKAGSLAATSAAMDLPREASISDTEVLVIGYRQLLRLWVRLNFAPEFYGDLPFPLEHYAPRPCFETEEPEDKDKLADRGKKNAEGLNTFLDAAAKARVDVQSLGIDWHEQAERCNLALLPMPEGQERKVKYLSEPAPQPQPVQMQPPAQTKRLSAREPESEDERLAGDCVWVSATWMDSSSLTRPAKSTEPH